MPARFSFVLIALMAAFAGARPATGQPASQRPASISRSAIAQIDALLAEKRSRTAVDAKIDSQLLYALAARARRPLAAGLPAMHVSLPTTADDRVRLDVRAQVSDALVQRIRALGAEVTGTNAAGRQIAATARLDRVRAIAALPGVSGVRPEYGFLTARVSTPSLRSVAGPEFRADMVSSLRRAREQRHLRGNAAAALSSAGSAVSEGDLTHRAMAARQAFGVSGFGVRIGVLADGVDGLAQAQASGEIGDVVVLPGQAGSGDEGTALLEVITDIAPGAELYFATARSGIAQFAQNIRDLRAAGCDIIIDEVTYLVESPFQDGQLTPTDTNGGIVTQAVKDVAASGAIYFSAAGNLGNVDAGTSRTYEGDFTDGGPVTGPLADAGVTGNVHLFAGATYNRLTAVSAFTTLHWSDPLGASDNDYDLFVLNSDGTAVVGASTNPQTGTQDPFESVSSVGSGRIVVVKVSGSGRFLHLVTHGGQLYVATSGAVFGHAATTAPNTFAVAATAACGPCAAPFTNSSQVESYSADGPRHIFFDASGTALTPGNVSSTGGVFLNKPDITAADRVTTSQPSGDLNPFVGTSVAAAHAAAIAALVKSADATVSATRVSEALIATAIDIHAAGVDRDSGYGIVMAYPAVAQAVPPPAPPSAAPIGIARTLTGANHLAFVWLPVPFATSYQLQYSTVRGAPKTSVYWSGSSPGALVGRLQRGVPYYFTLTASNAFGSVESSEVPFFMAANKAADMNGDGLQDFVLYRPSTGTWSWLVEAITGGTKQFGNQALGDVPFHEDVDGDGKSDLIVWRASTGTWYWTTSSSGFTDGGSRQWGNQGLGDVPLMGDIDGDGKAELIVWRASTGTWYWSTSASSYATGFFLKWGNQGLGDRPYISDMDADGKADFVVWRASTGTFYWITAGSGYTDGGIRKFGNQAFGDVPLLGDVDGDGKSDIAVWRPGSSTFFWTTSASGFRSGGWRQQGSGAQGDVPLLRDFNGFGILSFVTWRPSTSTFFWLDQLSGAARSRQFGDGTLGDRPIR